MIIQLNFRSNESKYIKNELELKSKSKNSRTHLLQHIKKLNLTDVAYIDNQVFFVKLFNIFYILLKVQDYYSKYENIIDEIIKIKNSNMLMINTNIINSIGNFPRNISKIKVYSYVALVYSTSNKYHDTDGIMMLFNQITGKNKRLKQCYNLNDIQDFDFFIFKSPYQNMIKNNNLFN